MSERCAHQFRAGVFCKRWAETGKRFCHDHSPDRGEHPRRIKGDHLHPLARLSTPEDLFDAVREAINATRLGRITPGQAYAMGYLADVWLRLNRAIGSDLRDGAVLRQFLPGILAEEAALRENLENKPPAVSGLPYDAIPVTTPPPSPALPPDDSPADPPPALPSSGLASKKLQEMILRELIPPPLRKSSA